MYIFMLYLAFNFIENHRREEGARGRVLQQALPHRQHAEQAAQDVRRR